MNCHECSINRRKSVSIKQGPHGSILRLYPLLTLAKARQEAAKALRNAELGTDPAVEKQEAHRAPTFEEVAREYLERHAKVRKKSWKEDERVINKELIPEFGSRQAKDITRRAARN